MFYMAMFEIHFAILRSLGDGDAFMSSEFQHTLNRKGMEATYAGSYLCPSIVSTPEVYVIEFFPSRRRVQFHHHHAPF
jgi:dolichyl-phosphate-mannose--protein O-mannosyl transferase